MHLSGGFKSLDVFFTPDEGLQRLRQLLDMAGSLLVSIGTENCGSCQNDSSGGHLHQGGAIHTNPRWLILRDRLYFWHRRWLERLMWMVFWSRNKSISENLTFVILLISRLHSETGILDAGCEWWSRLRAIQGSFSFQSLGQWSLLLKAWLILYITHFFNCFDWLGTLEIGAFVN